VTAATAANESSASNRATRLAEISGRQVNPAYVRIRCRGRTLNVLLDTGCTSSVIGSRLFPDLTVTGEPSQLFAANGTTVPIIGKTEITFSLAGVEVGHTFLVSDVISEMVLGIDFLVNQKCTWSFENATFTFRGKTMKLETRSQQSARWLDMIEEFAFEILHGAGIAYGNSDALSRCSCESEAEPVS
jgi:hypothetical protein